MLLICGPLIADFRAVRYFEGMPDTQKKKRRSPEDLQSSLQFLKGVGPHRAELLEKLGLRTIAEVLFFFPRDYQNFSQLAEVSELQEGT